jgi:hypothetical protein
MQSAPPPPVEWMRDTSPADWIAPRLQTFALEVGSIVPMGFEAYARIIHPVEMAPRSAQGLPLSERQVLIDLLGAGTAAPPLCWFCIWDGYSDLDHRGVTERVELPHRRYFLYRGPLGTALSSLPTVPPPPRARSVWYSREVVERWRRSASPPPSSLLRWPESKHSPNLWWPDDRSWCVATEVDLDWTYLGGSRALIERVLAEPALDARPVQSSDRPQHDDVDTLDVD